MSESGLPRCIQALWYDTSKAEWNTVESATGLDVDAIYAGRLPLAGEDEGSSRTPSEMMRP